MQHDVFIDICEKMDPVSRLSVFIGKVETLRNPWNTFSSFQYRVKCLLILICATVYLCLIVTFPCGV